MTMSLFEEPEETEHDTAQKSDTMGDRIGPGGSFTQQDQGRPKLFVEKYKCICNYQGPLADHLRQGLNKGRIGKP